MGLGGITVRLSGMGDAEMPTNDSGEYRFDGLRAGTYSVEISGFETDKVSFSSTSGAATVGVGETKVVTFDGTYIRTAGIQGQVSVEGEGLEGVTVTLKGDDVDRTEITNSTGQYTFSKLKSGTYQVGIVNPDPEDYEFMTTSQSATVATGETVPVDFKGTLLRTAGIAGRVGLDDGMGLDGVTVTLAGAADRTTTTMNGGQYGFANLGAGTYVLSITNPNPTAYNFADDEMQKTVVLADEQSEIVNFSGTHTRTAQISGMLFIDEVDQNKMYTTGEPSITEAIAPLVAAGALDPAVVAGLLAKAKVMLRGPDLNTVVPIDIQADGSFSTGESLMAGSYQLELPVNDADVAAALDAAGVAFVGGSEVRTIEAGGRATVNFPFWITMQTVSVGAVMGTREMITDPPRPVEGVELELYPTAEDAEDGTNMLGTAGATDMMGMATFSYARADDTSPAGEATDNLVFVKVAGHHDDLSVSDNPIIEIEYPGVARVHAAPAHVRLLNTAVRFQFWVKSDADAEDGDAPLAGWHTQVYMGDPKADGAMPLMKPDPMDATKMVNLVDPTESGEGEDGGELGRAMVSYKVSPDDLGKDGVTFTVMVSPDTDDWAQPMAMGETWEEEGDDRLTYTHTGFEVPATNTHEMNDLMATYVTFKTQKLTVGVYREADDEPGFTDFQSRVSEGDHRPAAGVVLRVSVMVEADGRRGLEVYDEWDHDGKADTDPIDATLRFTGGMATFANLPADMEFTVQFDEGSNRVAVGGPDSRSDRVQAFGDDIMTLGKSIGAFGDKSGAGPEVMLCPLTTDTRPLSLDDDESACATFAYQWTTGTITGEVTASGGRQLGEDLDVTITANTAEHSEAPRDTDTDGSFGFSGVQDGSYTISVISSDNWTVMPSTRRVDVYHREFQEDDDAAIVGTPGTDDAMFSATKMRLAIKGYVANIGHEPAPGGVVRGDETFPGAMLELYAFDEDAAATVKIKKKGGVLDAVEVGDDGMYEFTDLAEGKYVVVAKNTNDYEMYHVGPDQHYRNEVSAQIYADVLEQDLMLPGWDYAASTVSNSTDRHNQTATGGPDFTFTNFALLHGDGEFAGRVREARGQPGGIAVELRRCRTYTEESDGGTPGDTSDDTAESCGEETGFSAQTDNALSSGTWSFGSLREGYYVTNIAATTYWQARYDNRGRIDDDAIDCAGTGIHDPGTTIQDVTCDQARTAESYGLLAGKQAFNRGGVTFYVYNRTLGSADELTDLEVTGTPNADSVDIDIADGQWTIPTPQDASGTDALTVAGTGMRQITFASASVEVDATVSTDASYVVISNTGTDDGPVGHSSGVVTIRSKRANKATTAAGATAESDTVQVTVRVVAENGYHDHDYTFNVERAAPVDNNLALLTANENRSGSGGGITINASDPSPCDPASPAGLGVNCDEYRATVPNNTGTVYLFATTKVGQKGIEVVSDGSVISAEARHTNDAANVRVYKITVPATGVVNKTATIKVTSEDTVAKTYYITLNRS